MKLWQRTVCYFLVNIVCIILFSGCSEKIVNNLPVDHANLNEWLGDYSFYEFYPPNITMKYNINILKERYGFLAVNVKGDSKDKNLLIEFYD